MPHHVVVDGSNLATEGRSAPSLKQLNEAVLAYMAEDPTALITVVVDATFGHRIDPKEVAEFDDAVSNNELVAPPAGAIGRGDAFVLSIAHKVNANILTNDSYQEFHAQYDWLFDEGRLIGGKPVPHIGWVFVNRLPVRGPLSRKVTSEAKRKGNGVASDAGRGRGRGRSSADEGTVRVGSPEASLPMPVPKSPPPRRVAVVEAVEVPEKPARGRGGRGRKGEAERAPKPVADVAAAPAAGSTVNDLLSFLTFIERHPAGTSVNAIVDHYSSHGAYVRIGDVVGYVPLRLMAEPAPRSAREFMKVGESVTLIVESFVPTKRSVDLAVPGMGTAKELGEAVPAKAAKVPKKASKKVSKSAAPDEVVQAADKAPKPSKAGKSTTADVKKLVAPPVVEVLVPKAAKAPATKTTGAIAIVAPKAAVVKKAPAAKAAVAKKSPAPKAAPAKKTPAPKPSAPKTPASKAPASKAPVPVVVAKKAPAKKVPAKKAAAAPAVAAPPARRGRAKA
ncbi:MAG TPA: hypothetical protein PK020_08550 [Ilumatobacteraceae bacterium]|nr:hypothetical protein [Ilumatobacteraceae bacterium]